MKSVAKRCAIYTRKSTEEGLDQAFNSLHAQREACEAYILSQAGEGWEMLPAHYDDGGFSGGNMERPGLKALLADIDAGRVDILVVYKVDRLTRSLADFAKIVERLDEAGASFVSVTQAFNTTNSMGRLTLNVLLSFAQFEREVTGERIRDKIALSKAKGMWMGGVTPLGYDVKDRKLIINPAEAETVRGIFRRYLDLRSVRLLQIELQRSGVRSKLRTTKSGRSMGGGILHRGALFGLLQNRLYLGEITHKEKHYPGEHDGIIDAELFAEVQRVVAENRVAHSTRTIRSAGSPLVGKIFDAAGRRMTPAFGYGKGGQPYRYYVSAPVQTGQVVDDREIRRLSAEAVEAFLTEQLDRILGTQHGHIEGLQQAILRVEVGVAETQLLLSAKELPSAGHPELLISALRGRLAPGEDLVWEGEDRSSLRLRLPLRLKLRGGRAWLNGERYVVAASVRDRSLVNALKGAHRLLAKNDLSPLSPLKSFAAADGGLDNPRERRLAVLAFLAPELQTQIVEGHQLAGLDGQRIRSTDLPLAWADQPAWLATIADTAN